MAAGEPSLLAPVPVTTRPSSEGRGFSDSPQTVGSNSNVPEMDLPAGVGPRRTRRAEIH
ncbi:hypothetical protein LY76DRAFT_592054 [Colletotrichum caudatum]|nr:hypothetical protein LY76DRAFT_592054 [Colletotrichum caudatum]